jgi:hypothetical protein
VIHACGNNNVSANENEMVEIIGIIGPEEVVKIEEFRIFTFCKNKIIYKARINRGTLDLFVADLDHPVIATIPVEEFPKEAMIRSIDETINRAEEILSIQCFDVITDISRYRRRLRSDFATMSTLFEGNETGGSEA